MSPRRLTLRQRQIVSALVEPGATQATVAERLGISEQTLKNHLQVAYRAYGVRSLAQLVAAMGKRKAA